MSAEKRSSEQNATNIFQLPCYLYLLSYTIAIRYLSYFIYRPIHGCIEKYLYYKNNWRIKGINAFFYGVVKIIAWCYQLMIR